MLFSEPAFFVFFVVYLTLHFVTPPKWRIFLIIAGSAVFYSWWRVDYVYIPFLLAGISWIGALYIENSPDTVARKSRLALTLILLFTPLVFFKYSSFIANDILKQIPVVADVLGNIALPKLALPLGISFITFTLTAYVVDVYSGRFPIERRPANVLGFALFFPHLIAGPILRPSELLPQLKQFRAALRARFTLGLLIFAIGLVKKLGFADNLAGSVDAVYRPDANPTGWEYLLAIHGFAVQIYCDFSGYTDMAIGLACMICVHLPTNFRRPYSACSIIEFWRSWHITLSFWLRDYLYVPLGGNRHGRIRRIINILITMVLGGLWHGAAWTFVVWGALHGVALAAVHLARSPLRRVGIVIAPWICVLLTFYFVALTWVFFRAPDLATAHRVLTGPFSARWTHPAAFVTEHLFEIVLIIVFFATHRFDRLAYARIAVRRVNAAILWPLIATLFILAIAVSQGSSAKFIYFDF